MNNRLRHKISCNIRLWLYKRGYITRKIDEDMWVIRAPDDDRHLALLIRREDPKDFTLTYAPDLNEYVIARLLNTVKYAISEALCLLAAEYEKLVPLHSSPYIC